MKLDEYTWYITRSRHELVKVSTKRLGDIKLARITQVGQSYNTCQGNLRRACSCKVIET